MSHSIQKIVSRLNDPPHDLNLRLVAFDEKKPIELIQILLNVFVSIDASNPGDIHLNARLYHENAQAVKKSVIPFLSTLQYPSMPKEEDELEAFVTAIANGNQGSIYPILLYCLSNQDMLKERMYVAPFLTTILLPLDVTMTQRDDALSDLSRCYQARQEEFKSVFHQYTTIKKEEDALNQKSKDNDLEILQDEKDQLLDNIGEMEDRVRKSAGTDFESFQRLVKATSALRREQDEDNRLCGKLDEQKRALESTSLKLKQMRNRHESIRAMHGGSSNQQGSYTDLDSQSLLDGMRREVAEVTMTVRSTLVSEGNDLHHQIKLLKQERDKPIRTEEELEQLLATREQLQQNYDATSNLLEKEKMKSSHRKIAMFRQHATVSATKLKAKERELQSKRDQLDVTKKRVAQLRSKLAGSTAEIKVTGPVELPDGRILRGSEIQRHVDSCRDVLIQEDVRKKLISDLTNTNNAMEGTISELKAKHTNARQFLETREEEAGVKGFHAIQETLQNVQKDTEEVNKTKGETLQEISDIVTEMTEKLKREREKLQPMITDLKSKRIEFKRVQTINDSKKVRYDKLSSKLASERHHLERECDRLQSEWKQSERNYHYLANVNEVARVNLEKIEMEENWKNGDDKMLPDFKCLHDLYEHKLVQQENLAKQLRIEQRLIKENEPENMKQRQMFSCLQKLMQLKVGLKKEETTGESFSSGSENGNDSSVGYDPISGVSFE